MKTLHITFHSGCANVIKSVLDMPEIELTTKIVTSGSDGYYYNMTKERADFVWENEKEFFNAFDVIITSDTAPLSRIFLYRFPGKLIIYVCNRFDYSDTKDPEFFPDEEYYRMLKNTDSAMMGYTEFESIYAADKDILIKETIKPATRPYYNLHKEGYYIPTYYNDTMHKLAEKFPMATTGRYKDRHALSGFRAVLHLPYSWSSIALYDALALGLAYYVPSKELLLNLIFKTDGYWFQNANYCKKYLDVCEFYQKENSIFVKHFDSFEDIHPIELNHEQIYQKAEEVFETAQNQWRNLLCI